MDWHRTTKKEKARKRNKGAKMGLAQDNRKE